MGVSPDSAATEKDRPQACYRAPFMRNPENFEAPPTALFELPVKQRSHAMGPKPVHLRLAARTNQVIPNVFNYLPVRLHAERHSAPDTLAGPFIV